MDNDLSRHKTQEKYRRIVENTIRECNRVIDSWETHSKKTTTYDDYISLLNSYLTKFIRHEFNYKNGFKISNYSPLCYVENNKIVKISLSELTSSYYRYSLTLTELKQYLDNFNFNEFNKKLELEKFVQTNDYKPINHLSDISFDDIKKIKF